MKILETCKKNYFILDEKNRKKGALLFLLMLIVAFIEMVGIASIMPLVALLSDTDLIEKNKIINQIYLIAGFESKKTFLYVVSITVLLLFITSLLLKVLTVYAQNKFSLMSEYELSRRLVSGYLMKPYEWFLNQNSAKLGNKILNDVSYLIHNSLIPMLNLIAQSTIAISIVGLLIFINPIVAISSIVFLGVSYYFIFILSQNKLSIIGERRDLANKDRFKTIGEMFAGIKEVKINGAEKYYLEKFSYPAKSAARHQGTAQIIAQIPRYLFEGIAFGGLLIIAIINLNQTNKEVNILPMVVLYAFAGYRLLPALQQIYVALTQLKFNSSLVDSMYEEINGLKNIKNTNTDESISFNKSLKVIDISYSYPGSTRDNVRKVTFELKAKEIIAFVGKTGSGKTTVVDILLGLLIPKLGCIKIDEEKFNPENFREWCKKIGYVPQNVYLTDSSLLSNIAFGLEEKEIDRDRVEEVAKIANIHDFIVNVLPQGYETIVGDRGVRLSGGEKQRIAIARAIYKNPSLLIMDEATSALDNITEKLVMNSIYNISKKISVILIAHRLTTIKDCNCIYYFKDGEITDSGTFNELVKNNKDFSKMANNEII